MPDFSKFFEPFEKIGEMFSSIIEIFENFANFIKELLNTENWKYIGLIILAVFLLK